MASGKLLDETIVMSKAMSDEAFEDRVDAEAAMASYRSRGMDPEAIAALFPADESASEENEPHYTYMRGAA